MTTTPRTLATLGSAFIVSACFACHPHGTAPTPTPAPAVAPPKAICAVRIEAPSSPPASPSELVVPSSEVVVRLAFDTAALTARLSKEVPPRVAAGRNIDAGVAGKLRYHIDRSPFSVSVDHGRLFVSTHLTSRADLCKPLGPLGCVDYAHCSPEAHATASIPLSLGSRYRPGPAAVSIRVTRACRIANIDATSRIQRGADEQARRIQQHINAMLPSFANDAQLLWNTMGVHVPLGIDTRLRIRPEHVVEGPPTQDRSRIYIPLGVRGSVLIEPRQGERDEVGNIPSPLYVDGLEPGLRLNLPVNVDLAAIDADLSRSVRNDVINSTTKILSVQAVPDGTSLRLLVSVHGQYCGLVGLSAKPVFDPPSGRIRLAQVTPIQHVRRSTALPIQELQRITATIQANASIALPVDPTAMPSGLERAVELLSSDDGPDVRVTVDDVNVERVVVTSNGLAALVSVRGSADVVIR